MELLLKWHLKASLVIKLGNPEASLVLNLLGRFNNILKIPSELAKSTVPRLVTE